MPHEYAKQVPGVPQHLCCMLSPAGILTAGQMRQTVSLNLESEHIFVGPDGKVGFTHQVKHKIDTKAMSL